MGNARYLNELEDIADALLDARMVVDFLIASVEDDETRCAIVDIKDSVVLNSKRVEVLVARLKQAEVEA